MNLPEAGQGGRELQMSPEALEAGSMRESLYEQMLELGQRAVPGVADVQPAPHAALAAGHVDVQRAGSRYFPAARFLTPLAAARNVSCVPWARTPIGTACVMP